MKSRSATASIVLSNERAKPSSRGRPRGIERQARAGQRAGAERALVGGGIRRAQALGVALEHPRVRGQVVAEQDRLRALQVRVAGHHQALVGARAGDQRLLGVRDGERQLARGVLGPEARGDGDLVVARAAGVHLAAERARAARRDSARDRSARPRRARRPARQAPRRARRRAPWPRPRRAGRRARACARAPARRARRRRAAARSTGSERENARIAGSSSARTRPAHSGREASVSSAPLRSAAGRRAPRRWRRRPARARSRESCRRRRRCPPTSARSARSNARATGIALPGAVRRMSRLPEASMWRTKPSAVRRRPIGSGSCSSTASA